MTCRCPPVVGAALRFIRPRTQSGRNRISVARRVPVIIVRERLRGVPSMTTALQAGKADVSVADAWGLGVRARLLLAFFGISAFAVLAAAAGIYAFREVGDRLDIVDTRVPSTLTSLELSRSADRIIAAAP